MARTLTLRAVLQSLVGDETYECWLKHASDVWLLQAVGSVVPTLGHQDLTIAGLIDGDSYVAQIRLKRDGQYRIGYLTSDPDTWPSASRCEFTTGHLIGTTAPTIIADSWTRVDVSHSHVNITVTPSDAAIDLVLYRDGVQIALVAAPHVGDVVMVDPTPPTGVSHTYNAYHTQGFLISPPSNTVTVFCGLVALTGFEQTTPLNAFYQYHLAWDALSAGESIRIQDDYLAVGVFADQTTINYPGATTTLNVQKNSSHSSNGNVHVHFGSRARRENGVDVSPWVTLDVECDIASDETAYSPR